MENRINKKLNDPTNHIRDEIPTEDIRRGFKVVSAVPTAPPKTNRDSIIIYRSGVTRRLYIYDEVNGEWLYETLTS